MKCIVLNCENEYHQGKFTGKLCNPCFEFITTNKGKFSQAYRNTMRELTEDTECQYCKQGCFRCDSRKALTEDEIREVADSVCHTWKKNGVGELYMTDFARAILKKASEK